MMKGSIPHMAIRYVFRADASPEIGAGHVMRLCSIIEEMLERELVVLLVGNIKGIPWLAKRVETLGNKLKFIEENDFISDPSSDVLIIDSYTLDIDSDFFMKKKWLKIAALVEVGTPKYKADLYIHCGTNSKIESDYEFLNSKFIGGIEYLPIRQSIQKIENQLRIVGDIHPLRILVVGGGTDPLNFVRKFSLELLKFKQEFYAVLISDQPDICIPLDGRFSQRSIGTNLESELVDSDLIFTLSGTSSWDFLSCGFPLGIAMGFENQEDNYEFQVSNKLAIGIGKFTSKNMFEFNIENINSLMQSHDLRMELSRMARMKVDSLGVERIVKALVELAR